MSEKRFFAEVNEDESYVIDNMEHLVYGVFECADLLNAFNEENNQLIEKVKELTFNDYKRCLEIINHQRTIIQKIEKLTGQTIEELIINLDKGVEME